MVRDHFPLALLLLLLLIMLLMMMLLLLLLLMATSTIPVATQNQASVAEPALLLQHINIDSLGAVKILE